MLDPTGRLWCGGTSGHASPNNQFPLSFSERELLITTKWSDKSLDAESLLPWSDLPPLFRGVRTGSDSKPLLWQPGRRGRDSRRPLAPWLCAPWVSPGLAFFKGKRYKRILHLTLLEPFPPPTSVACERRSSILVGPCREPILRNVNFGFVP